MLTTEGTLLGGQVRYTQPRTGFRSGIEPVLLAAAVPARPGARVLEGGSGAGAALLCLAWRVPRLEGVGVERDPELAELARGNAATNDRRRVGFVTADMALLPELGRFDHACANPPYHPLGGTASPDPAREGAKRGEPGLPGLWAVALAARLRPGGTLTLILPALALAVALDALDAAGCGSVIVFPLWPKIGRPAKLILLRGVRGGRAPLRLAPGLILHEEDGRFTAAAEACLRGGAVLEL